MKYSYREVTLEKMRHFCFLIKVAEQQLASVLLTKSVFLAVLFLTGKNSGKGPSDVSFSDIKVFKGERPKHKSEKWVIPRVHKNIFTYDRHSSLPTANYINSTLKGPR